jgi:glucose-6-phosphate isomerase
LSLEELQSQLEAETRILQTLQGKNDNETERRKHVTELKRHQAWLEHEPEIAKVIEDVLQTGNTFGEVFKGKVKSAMG